MRRLLFTDPITKKKSFTLTALTWSFLLFIACVVCFLAGVAQDYRISMVSLFAVGMFGAAYQQKRIKLGFSGVEIEHDKGVCNANSN